MKIKEKWIHSLVKVVVKGPEVEILEKTKKIKEKIKK